MPVRLATRDGWPAIAAALARAFYDDPFTAFAVPDASRRLEVMGAMFEAQLALVFSGRSRVYTVDGGAAAAIWTSDDAPPLDAASDEAIGERMEELFGARFSKVVTALGEVRAHRPDAPWGLDWLGTDPARQRKGHATAMLAPVLRELDERGLAARLWTTTDDNVRFYKGRGFEVTCEVQPSEAPRAWWMKRQPQSH